MRNWLIHTKFHLKLKDLKVYFNSKWQPVEACKYRQTDLGGLLQVRSGAPRARATLPVQGGEREMLRRAALATTGALATNPISRRMSELYYLEFNC